MRLIIAAEYFRVGASETYAFSLADGLAKRGHKVALLALPHVVPVADRYVSTPNAAVASVPLESLPRLWQVLGCIRHFRPDVVHVNDPASVTLAAAWASRVPVRVVTDHVLPASTTYNFRGTVLHKLTQRAANALIVFSEHNARAAPSVWRRLSAQLIYPGIPAPECSEPRQQVRSQLGLSESDFAVCTVGRLIPEKRHDVFIRAMRLARRRDPHIRGFIVGDGPESLGLTTLIRSLGLESVVALMGHRQDVSCVLRGVDLYVHCSEREGFGFALVEAMAAGLPVAISEQEAMKEVVGDTSAPVFNFGDDAALANHILDLARSREAARELGERLRARWEKAFSVDRMVLEHERLYENALASRS